jgi:hypothetical protein
LAKTLLLSGVAVVGTVAGLVYLGRTAQGDAPHKAEKVNETLSAVAAASAAQVETTARPPLPMGAAIQHAARALVPEEAWLVVDFRGDLTGARPFEDQAGSCKDVPAPLRVVVALLAPLSKTAAGPELLLAAPQVTDEFWGCARDRVVSAGGTVLAQNAQYEVIKSPSGVVALGPHRSMIFLSNEGYLERGLTVMSDLGESAANTSAHAGLFRQLHPTGSVEMPTDLDLTLQLPADWLNSVGQDAQATPLRHLQAAYLSIAAQGGARGGISCAEPGCAEMLQFLQASKRDLLEALPQERARLIDQGLELIYQPSAGAGAGSRGAAATPTTGNITVRWSNASTKLQDVLGGLLPSGNLWGAPRP